MGIKEELIFVLRAKMEEFVTEIVEDHSFASQIIRKSSTLHGLAKNITYIGPKSWLLQS